MTAILLIPFYCCIKDERRLIAINERFSKAVFAPIALILTLVFACMNLLLVPFAYLKAIYIKIMLICSLNRKKAAREKKGKP